MKKVGYLLIPVVAILITLVLTYNGPAYLQEVPQLPTSTPEYKSTEVLTATAFSTERPATCTDGDTAIQTSQIDLANKIFSAILVSEPQSLCALRGLQKVTDIKSAIIISCNNADSYRTQNHFSLAEQTYKATLNANPGTRCALEGLELIAEKKCSLAGSRLLHFDIIGAKDIYDNVKTEYPNLPCAVSGLAKIQLLKTLAIIFVIILVMLLLYLRDVIVKLFGLHLNVTEFEFGTLTDSNKFSKNFAKSMVFDLDRSLKDLAIVGKPERPDLIEQPVEAPDLPEISSIPPEVNALVKFIYKLIPHNTLTVKCILEFSENQGAGISFKLIGPDNNLILCGVEWQADLNPNQKSWKISELQVNDYFNLVEWIAIRIMWGKYMYKYKEKVAKEKLHRIYGTDNADSFIFTRLALKFTHIPNEKEERLLRMALANDKENHLAMYYLGKNLIRANKRELKSEGIDYINNVRKNTCPSKRNILNMRKSKGTISEYIYIAANYTLGTTKIDEYLVSLDVQPQTIKGHEQKLEQCLTDAKNYLIEASKIANENKKFFGKDYFIMVDIPYQDVLWWSGSICAGNKILDIIEEKYSTARIIYNLACHNSLGVELGKFKDAKGDKLTRDKLEEKLNEAIDLLRDTFLIAPEYVEYSKHDRTLKTLRAKKKNEYQLLAKHYKTPIALP